MKKVLVFLSNLVLAFVGFLVLSFLASQLIYWALKVSFLLAFWVIEPPLNVRIAAEMLENTVPTMVSIIAFVLIFALLYVGYIRNVYRELFG